MFFVQFSYYCLYIRTVTPVGLSISGINMGTGRRGGIAV